MNARTLERTGLMREILKEGRTNDPQPCREVNFEFNRMIRLVKAGAAPSGNQSIPGILTHLI